MDALLLGLSLGLGAGLAPGPLLAVVVQATLAGGFRAGARVASAPLLTDAPIIAVCALALSGLSETVLALLSLGGAAFVGWMAVDALRAPEGGAADRVPGLWRAALVNVLSPHPWLFWVTVGGPLLVSGSVAAGAAFLAGFYALLVGAKVAIAFVVARARTGPRFASRLAAPRVLTRLGGARVVSAALLALAGIALLVDAIARLS